MNDPKFGKHFQIPEVCFIVKIALCWVGGESLAEQ